MPLERHAFGEVDDERRNRLQALRPRPGAPLDRAATLRASAPRRDPDCDSRRVGGGGKREPDAREQRPGRRAVSSGHLQDRRRPCRRSRSSRRLRARYAPAGTSASSVSANAPVVPTVVSPTLDPRRALATLDRDHGSRQSRSHGPAKRGRIDRSRARQLDARRDLDEHGRRRAALGLDPVAHRASRLHVGGRRSRSCRTSPPFRRTTTSRPATTRAAVCRGSGRSRTAAPPSRRRPSRSTVGRGGGRRR